MPEAIWKLNDANLASASAADPIWQRNIYERQQRVAQDLTEWLLPMFGIEPGTMWFAYDNPSQDDVELQTNRMAAGFTNGAVYLNEYRQALGLNPLPDEQNVLGKPQPMPMMPSAPIPVQEIAAEQGTDAFGRLEQIAMEAAYVKELAQKYEIPETAIRLVTNSLPSTPAAAAAAGDQVAASAAQAQQAASPGQGAPADVAEGATPDAPVEQVNNICQ